MAEAPRSASRRALGQHMLAGARRVLGKLQTETTPLRKLQNIESMSFEELQRLGAAIAPGVTIEERERILHAYRTDGEGKVDLGVAMACSPENAAAFALFDGRHTLAEIAGVLAEKTSWDPLRARDHVRGLFVNLLNRGVCIPVTLDE
jgi:hypothetical protein